MPETVNDAFLNQPAGTEDPTLGDDRIRAFKAAWKERLEKEHYLDLNEAGSQPRQGLHRAGSAVSFYQGTAPTQRNGVALGTSDAGLLWLNSSSSILYVYSGSSWVPIYSYSVETLTSSKTYSSGEITKNHVIILNNSSDISVDLVSAAATSGIRVTFIQTGAGVATVTYGTSRTFTLVRYTVQEMVWDGANWYAPATSHGRRIFGPGALSATVWNVPPGVRKILVTGAGQGGTGAAGVANTRSGGGGGSGAWCRNLELNVIDGEAITVTLSTSAASTLTSALSGLNLSFGMGGNGSGTTGGAGGTGSGGVSNGYSGGTGVSLSGSNLGGGGGGGVGGSGSTGSAIGIGAGGGSGSIAADVHAGLGSLGPYLNGPGGAGSTTGGMSGAGAGGGGSGGFGSTSGINNGSAGCLGGGGGGGGAGTASAGGGGAGGDPFIVIEW